MRCVPFCPETAQAYLQAALAHLVSQAAGGFVEIPLDALGINGVDHDSAFLSAEIKDGTHLVLRTHNGEEVVRYMGDTIRG